MNTYEIMTITDLSLSEDGARDVSNNIKDLISSFGGKILNSDFMGKRNFAYPINKQTAGFYEVIVFELEASNTQKLKNKLNLTEGLVRYLITKR